MNKHHKIAFMLEKVQIPSENIIKNLEEALNEKKEKIGQTNKQRV